MSIVLWLVVAAVTLVVDLVTSAFLFVWFTVGAVAAIIAELIGWSFAVQVVLFIIVSIIVMSIGYPMVKRALKKTVKATPTTEQGYIGRELTMDEEVMDRATVKIDGIYWTVKNDGELIRKGDRVRITGIEGNKIIIRKI